MVNPIVVKKTYDKWWVCVNFTYLNKVCLKDSSITSNKLIGWATVAHQLLSFMDVFSRYNQFLTNLNNHEKDLFSTKRGIYCYKIITFWFDECWSNVLEVGQSNVCEPPWKNYGKLYPLYVGKIYGSLSTWGAFTRMFWHVEWFWDQAKNQTY